MAEHAGPATYQHILYEVEDPVATITLNRPDRLNAWTPTMERELKHALGSAERDRRVVGIVLTGAGRGFCAGADMATLQSLSDGASIAGLGAQRKPAAQDTGDPGFDPGFRQTYSYLASLRKPLIAAINGPCVGMAVPIVCFADLRFASDRAYFSTAFARRGLVAEWGSAFMLTRLCGLGHAFDLLYSGRRVDAEEASRMGLCNRVLPHDELLAHCTDYVRELAKHCSPRSLSVMKHQLYHDLIRGPDEALREATRRMFESLEQDDFKEGVASFLQKRPPSFARVGDNDDES